MPRNVKTPSLSGNNDSVVAAPPTSGDVVTTVQSLSASNIDVQVADVKTPDEPAKVETSTTTPPVSAVPVLQEKMIHGRPESEWRRLRHLGFF